MPLILDQPRDAINVWKKRRPAIEIGLLNNLSDAGLESCERMFSNILAEVAGRNVIRLRLFSLPSIQRSAATQARMISRYVPFQRMLAMRLDGLIVTGCEPNAASLKDEPFWSDLTLTLDWADRNTRSSIWSCLGSHAAVLHLDGIARRRLHEKCSGIFAVSRASEHPLLLGAGERLQVVHSRQNEVDAADLRSAGYEILTQSASIGVDTFIKRQRSFFVFLQGHPEYDEGGLAREYRRDALRFLDGRSDCYPPLPTNYFAQTDAKTLSSFAELARRRRDEVCIAELLLALQQAKPRRLQSRTYPRALFQNWLWGLAAKAADRAA